MWVSSAARQAFVGLVLWSITLAGLEFVVFLLTALFLD